ncbi:MAG: hypothetical protein M3Y72_11300 [Acidobacteriota bacterium]|nr:hypothetical protein [Acidobacteriota bacterium]
MPKTYRLEIEIILTDEQQQRAVEVARQLYAANPASSQEDEGVIRELTAEEFVDGPSSALMSIIDQNAILEDLDIHLSEVSCTDPDDEVIEDDIGEEIAVNALTEFPIRAHAEEDEDELDEWEDGIYLCRWPNGEFSIVKAASKREAIIDLDEWAGAHPSWLIPLNTFMVDFRLDDSGQIELNSFGEETVDLIRSHCYPELDAVLTSDALTSGPEEYSDAQKEMTREAVERERTRLWHLQPEGPAAKTQFGKDLQKIMGTTGTVADHYVELATKDLLQSKRGEGKKPN